MRIALDAHGGDMAPVATIGGAISALHNAPWDIPPRLEIALFGDPKILEEHLPSTLPNGLTVVPCCSAPGENRFFGDKDDPASDSPIRRALQQHAEGSFDAVVSAGSTGAQVVASIGELGKCQGITRPAIGSLLPTAKGSCLLIDVGASLVASPHHLVQFAAMGQVYVHELLGIKEPTIGLLNVGTESHSGGPVPQEAHELLEASGLNFYGFVEGRDLPVGTTDIVVTNGFAGNVLLKYIEGLPQAVQGLLPGDNSILIETLRRRFDFELFGGEPLLGVRGVSIICHGASSKRAIASAINKATKIAQIKLWEKIEALVAEQFPTYYTRFKYLRSFQRTHRSN